MKRYVLTGASGRGFNMYGRQIVENYSDVAEVVGVFDKNPIRATFVRDSLDPTKTIPVYTDFDKMMTETKPDVSIVTTMDSSHAEYISRSLDYGVETITEKPMCIDAQGVQQIVDAEERNGKKIMVTFNYRFTPATTKVKELIRAGEIGEVKSVHFEWMLDKRHGADYFRRWHKMMKNGGGLFVTKATHHFDMVNWWLEQDPIKVFANGNLSFYGPGKRDYAQVRCSTCTSRDECDLPFGGFDDITMGSSKRNEYIKNMYFDAEPADGYMRDQCLYADTDIFDNMSVSVQYSKGALMSYTLTAFNPLEGVQYAITGTHGRIEGAAWHNLAGSFEDSYFVKLYKDDGTVIDYKLPKGIGGHGGGDKKILDRIFRGVKDGDPLGHIAGSRDGAMSVLTGAAANISVLEDRPVYIPGMTTIL
jgi:predicted dehydrogenase